VDVDRQLDDLVLQAQHQGAGQRLDGVRPLPARGLAGGLEPHLERIEVQLHHDASGRPPRAHKYAVEGAATVDVVGVGEPLDLGAVRDLHQAGSQERLDDADLVRLADVQVDVGVRAQGPVRVDQAGEDRAL
jgi:hypothetical protein